MRKTTELRVGDRVRVTVDRACSANVLAGDEFVIADIEGNSIRVDAGWYFNAEVLQPVEALIWEEDEDSDY